MTEPEETFVHLVNRRASHDPSYEIFRFIADNGTDCESLSYAELDARARAGAAVLAELGRPGERVVLAYPAGLDFIVGFFACLYAGMIAVPVPLSDKPREAARLQSILRSAQPIALLSSGELTALEERAKGAGLARPPQVRSLPSSAPGAGVLRLPDPSELAFLQYTSGSVGEPKGVMVTHANLMANERMIQDSFEHDQASLFVGWLPHFHDMGLIGNILQPLFLGSGATLMSPNAFVRDPLRWLELVSRFRARTSGGPNIAYELCALRAARNKTPLSLDLSSWDVAFVGAEPVRAQTMAAFSQAFAPYGFRPSSLLPCYGLAETTLFVSGAKKGEGVHSHTLTKRQGAHGKAQVLVSCGTPARGQSLAIVDPATLTRCSEGVEGEIWVAGAHVGSGYWDRPDESAASFAAHLPGDDARYLRTGDLGVLRNGTLTVTGRLKDLIILHGQNIYPQDVEETLERAHRALRRGCSAAFSLQGERGEQLVVVAEAVRAHASGGWSPIIDAIRETLATELDLAVSTVVLISPQSIHKTSSGKIQRRSVHQALLDGRLEVLAQSGPHTLPRRSVDAALESLP